MLITQKYTVSKVVETIKSNTSKALKIKFAFLLKVYWDDQRIWAKGYFVSMVEINEKIIKEYVKMQEKEEIKDKWSLNFESTMPIRAWESISIIR